MPLHERRVLCRSVPGGDEPTYNPMPQCRFDLIVQHAGSHPQLVHTHTWSDGAATAAAAEGCGGLHAAATASHRCACHLLRQTVASCSLDRPTQPLALVVLCCCDFDCDSVKSASRRICCGMIMHCDLSTKSAFSLRCGHLEQIQICSQTCC